MTREEFKARAKELAVPHYKNRMFDNHMVAKIRTNREGMTDKQRAAQLGCHPNTIWQIRNRVSYRVEIKE